MTKALISHNQATPVHVQREHESRIWRGSASPFVFYAIFLFMVASELISRLPMEDFW